MDFTYGASYESISLGREDTYKRWKIIWISCAWIILPMRLGIHREHFLNLIEDVGIINKAPDDPHITCFTHTLGQFKLSEY